jgi:hypothetical protein
MMQPADRLKRAAARPDTIFSNPSSAEPTTVADASYTPGNTGVSP